MRIEEDLSVGEAALNNASVEAHHREIAETYVQLPTHLTFEQRMSASIDELLTATRATNVLLGTLLAKSTPAEVTVAVETAAAAEETMVPKPMKPTAPKGRWPQKKF